MSKHNTHKSFSEMRNDKYEEKRQRQYVRMRDNNECGNNLWHRKDNKTLVLLCKQTGERCNMNNCPCFSKQS